MFPKKKTPDRRLVAIVFILIRSSIAVNHSIKKVNNSEFRRIGCKEVIEGEFIDPWRYFRFAEIRFCNVTL